MKLVTEICLSLSSVLSKYTMEKFYCNPYEICIWNGAIGLIMNIICIAIIVGLNLKIQEVEYQANFLEYFENYNIYDFITCLLIIMECFTYNICIFLTCNYFTPIHTLITSIIKECYTYIQINGGNGEILLNILGIVTLILIAFIFLIFIEIIEINIFNISYYTKRNIEIRSRNDSLIDKDNDEADNDEIIIEEEKLNISMTSSNDNP